MKGIVVLLLAVIVESRDIGSFVHLTDTHLQRNYAPGTSVTGKHPCGEGKGDAGRFGNFECDSPPSDFLEATWNFVAEEVIREPADFILWTGDHTSIVDPNVSRSDTEAILENISAALHRLSKRTGLRIFPTTGNHDSFPAYQFPATGSFVYKLVAELWKDWLSAESYDTVARGCAYTEVLRPGLRLVSLNTAIYFPANSVLNRSDPDPGGHIAWFRGTLAKSREKGERVIVMGHISPGYSEMSNGGMIWNWNDPLFDVFSEFSEVIVASFFGHHHSQTFRIFNGTSDRAGSVAFLTSAVSPRPYENPSFVRYYYDRSAPFTVLDQVSWWVDLRVANAKGKLEWKPLYRATELYGLKDLSLGSMRGFLERLKVDQKLFLTWYQHIKLLANEHYSKCDTAACQAKVTCIIDHIREKEWNKCP